MNHLDQVTQAVRRAIGAGLPTTTAIFAAARSEIRAAKISGYRHRQINSAIEEAGLKISETYYRRLYSSDRIQKKNSQRIDHTQAQTVDVSPTEHVEIGYGEFKTVYEDLAKARKVAREVKRR